MTINRLTIPEEFYDITSPMLLRAPEPQYLYAVLWKMAFKRGLDRKVGGLGLMPGRLAGGTGSPFPDVQEFEMQLSDPIYSNAFMAIPDTVAKVGHTVRINRPRFSDTTYTQAAREVTRKTISTTPTQIGSEQVALTIKQWGGPYDLTQDAVAPFGLDSFDASRAVHDLGEEVGTHLQRDFDKTIDAFIGTMLDAVDPGVNRNAPVPTSSSTGTVWPSTAITSDNQILTPGSGQMSYDMLLRGIENLELAKVPKFPTGNYACVIGPTEKAELATDDDWLRASVFTPRANPLIAASYYKSMQGLDVFVSQTLNTYNNTSSLPIRRNHMWGPGVMGGMVVPVSGLGGVGPRVAAATDDNYGLTAKVIWVLEAGFTLFDMRFGTTLRTG